MKALIAPRGIHLVLMIALEPKDIDALTGAGENGGDVVFIPLLGQAEDCTAIAMMSPATFELTHAKLRDEKIPHVVLETVTRERGAGTPEMTPREVLIDDKATALEALLGLTREAAVAMLDAAQRKVDELRTALDGAASEGAAPEGTDEMVERVLAAARDATVA